MWNVVYLDSQPYYLDATWDDGYRGGNAAGYAYFNVTGDALAESHLDRNPADSGCVYTACNYFVREGRYFTAWDEPSYGMFAELLTAAVGRGETTFDVAFESDGLLQTALESLLTDQRVYDALREAAERTGRRIATDFINYSVNEQMRVLHLSLTENYEEGA